MKEHSYEETDIVTVELNPVWLRKIVAPNSWEKPSKYDTGEKAIRDWQDQINSSIKQALDRNETVVFGHMFEMHVLDPNQNIYTPISQIEKLLRLQKPQQVQGFRGNLSADISIGPNNGIFNITAGTFSCGIAFETNRPLVESPELFSTKFNGAETTGKLIFGRTMSGRKLIAAKSL